MWAAEIGHIVDEYERSLEILFNILEQNETTAIGERLDSWIAYTDDLTVFTIQDVMQQLRGSHEKYLPPEPEDDIFDDTDF